MTQSEDEEVPILPSRSYHHGSGGKSKPGFRLVVKPFYQGRIIGEEELSYNNGEREVEIKKEPTD